MERKLYICKSLNWKHSFKTKPHLSINTIQTHEGRPFKNVWKVTKICRMRDMFWTDKINITLEMTSVCINIVLIWHFRYSSASCIYQCATGNLWLSRESCKYLTREERAKYWSVFQTSRTRQTFCYQFSNNFKYFVSIGNFDCSVSI